MVPPVKPSEEDCCNSGCNPCVFDVYQLLLQTYDKRQAEVEENTGEQINLIKETTCTFFKIVFIKNLCDDHLILAFQFSGERGNGKLYWDPGHHFLIKFTGSNKVYTKAYTPVRVDKIFANIDYDFAIIVKKYIGGPVSNYLFSKQVGDELLWRGPYGSFTYQANKYKRMCFVAQGTGIAPFWSIVNCVLNNEKDETIITLYYCTRSVETILFRSELYSFRQFWNFTYSVFLSQYENELLLWYKEPVQCKRLDSEYINTTQNVQSSVFLLCGSDEFSKEYYDSLSQHAGRNKVITF